MIDEISHQFLAAWDIRPSQGNTQGCRLDKLQDMNEETER